MLGSRQCSVIRGATLQAAFAVQRGRVTGSYIRGQDSNFHPLGLSLDKHNRVTDFSRAGGSGSIEYHANGRLLR